MLGASDDDLIAGGDDQATGRVRVVGARPSARGGPARAGVPDGQGDEIDRLRGVLGEDELRASGPHEAGDGLSGVLPHPGGLIGDLVGRASSGPVGHAVEGRLALDDVGGLLAGGGPIEVGQRLAVARGALQVGEVGADSIDLGRGQRPRRRGLVRCHGGAPPGGFRCGDSVGDAVLAGRSARTRGRRTSTPARVSQARKRS